jgi:LPXTG-site transpeptidase (sortase) family protein
VRQLSALKWRLVPLVIAAVVLCIPLAESALNHHQVSQAAQAAEVKLKSSKPAAVQGVPSRVIIPSLSIDLPVVSQSYSKAAQTWPVSPTDANYATETAPNNNTQGETLIYGHATRQIFGSLLNISPGAVVYVYTNNGHLFKYAYAGSQDVTPYKLSIIDDMARAPAGLKMITCDGPYFQYRHLMSFKLLQAS